MCCMAFVWQEVVGIKVVLQAARIFKPVAGGGGGVVVVVVEGTAIRRPARA